MRINIGDGVIYECEGRTYKGKIEDINIDYNYIILDKYYGDPKQRIIDVVSIISVMHKDGNIELNDMIFESKPIYEKNDNNNDVVNHPQHYTFGKIEVIDVLEDWKLEYHIGNVVKYLARAKHKGNELQDCQKAKWYLDRYIQLLEKEKGK